MQNFGVSVAPAAAPCNAIIPALIFLYILAVLLGGLGGQSTPQNFAQEKGEFNIFAIA